MSLQLVNPLARVFHLFEHFACEWVGPLVSFDRFTGQLQLRPPSCCTESLSFGSLLWQLSDKYMHGSRNTERSLALICA